jgi:hypothetical protein
MIKNSYEFEILVNGKPVKEYSHEGSIYIEGKKGTRYSLRFRNNTSNRVLFIPSVDGLNALSGKRATDKDTGYIVDGYSSTTIDGWRTSDSEVAEFFFSTPEDSYAERKGKGQNVGVLGCVVVKEIEKPKEVIKYIHDTVYIHEHCQNPWCPKCHPGHYWNYGGGYYGDTNLNTSGLDMSSAQNASFYSASKADNSASINMVHASNKSTMSKQELGTGWGEKKYSEVRTVEFERESYPTETFEIFYNTRTQLERMGVNLNSRVQYVAPSAFKKAGEYCEEPDR